METGEGTKKGLIIAAAGVLVLGAGIGLVIILAGGKPEEGPAIQPAPVATEEAAAPEKSICNS